VKLKAKAPSPRVAVFVVAAAVVAVGAGVAGGPTGAAAHTAAKPKWLLMPGFWPGGTGPEVVGSASGRGWIGFTSSVSPDGSDRRVTLGSLRSVGGRLSFVKAVVHAWSPMLIVGSNLIYHSTDASAPHELRMAPLLTTGGVGTPRAVPDDPEQIPPQQDHPGVADGIQVGDRYVWVLTGFRITGETGFLWACCTSAGKLSDLSRFIDHTRLMRFLQLERDARGRLWLAWLDEYFRKVWGAVKMVELDPDTLAPRTPKPFVAPAPDSWLKPELVCAERCRVVVQDLGGDIFTWAPGERSATKMVSGNRTSPANLLAASFRPGGLEVASGRYLQLHKPPWSEEEISVARGDARGSQARSAGSAAPAPFAATSPMTWQPRDDAAFAPGGLVFFKKYYNFQHETQTRFLAGFLPLAR
jgi:hypothetical protein